MSGLDEIAYVHTTTLHDNTSSKETGVIRLVQPNDTVLIEQSTENVCP